ncbi:MAG: endonuclease/exonuclease/phosphatase family metal-dependent hydrolase [Candidatus Omnitrophota bacterium]|jgi:endonuclease/exonuclease/phosphatase family metal-dependent hydrolase
MTPKTRKYIKRLILILLGVPFLLGVLFVLNGTLLAKGEKPIVGTIPDTNAKTYADAAELTVVSFNIAKCFAINGRDFASEAEVHQRLDQMAQVIRDEDPDLVFISEAIFTCGPCPVNHVTYLAKATHMHSYACGECYNIGLPFYNVSGGTAILAKGKVEGLKNLSLAGRKPFYQTRNSRRALFAKTTIQGTDLLLASLHNDSFNPENNLVQIKQVLDFVGDQPAILAGDFNAMPEWDSIQTVKATGRYTGAFDGPHTFPSEKQPEHPRKIDFILAPASWILVEERVIETAVSDHYPIVATFRLSP